MGRGKGAVVVALAYFIVACSGADPHSSILTNADGLQTFSVIREIDGVPVTCGLPNEPSPVRGTLRGNPDDPQEVVWLEEGARRLSVVWPDGFAVRFEPDPVLYNDNGQAVAREGEVTELTQVSTNSAAGTFEDPYIASCWLFGEVYVYMP